MIKARRINPFTIDAVDAPSAAYRACTIGMQQKPGARSGARRGERIKIGHLRDFMRASSMHGLKYAADDEASCFERYVSRSLVESLSFEPLVLSFSTIL